MSTSEKIASINLEEENNNTNINDNISEETLQTSYNSLENIIISNSNALEEDDLKNHISEEVEKENKDNFNERPFIPYTSPIPDPSIHGKDKFVASLPSRLPSRCRKEQPYQISMWHSDAAKVGMLYDGSSLFIKYRKGGSISLIYEQQLRNRGLHGYSFSILNGHICASDGVGFVFANRVPCSKNIKRLWSVFVNRTGHIVKRMGDHLERSATPELPPLGIGRIVSIVVDLDEYRAVFQVSTISNQVIARRQVDLYDIAQKIDASCGYICAAVTNAGMAVHLSSCPTNMIYKPDIAFNVTDSKYHCGKISTQTNSRNVNAYLDKAYFGSSNVFNNKKNDWNNSFHANKSHPHFYSTEKLKYQSFNGNNQTYSKRATNQFFEGDQKKKNLNLFGSEQENIPTDNFFNINKNQPSTSTLNIASYPNKSLLYRTKSEGHPNIFTSYSANYPIFYNDSRIDKFSVNSNKYNTNTGFFFDVQDSSNYNSNDHFYISSNGSPSKLNYDEKIYSDKVDTSASLKTNQTNNFKPNTWDWNHFADTIPLQETTTNKKVDLLPKDESFDNIFEDSALVNETYSENSNDTMNSLKLLPMLFPQLIQLDNRTLSAPPLTSNVSLCDDLA